MRVGTGTTSLWIATSIACVTSWGCDGCSNETNPSGPPPSSTPAPAASVAPAPNTPATIRRTGQAMALSPDEKWLYVADEDHGKLRSIPLPLGTTGMSAIDLGPVAQVVALDDRVLVTVRGDPGLLVELQPQPGGSLSETRRIEIPADAWGLGVDPSEQRALVTSPWSRQLTSVDLSEGTIAWSIDTAREPRAVIVGEERAYVSHLVGNEITVVSSIQAQPPPEPRQIVMPASPLRAPSGKTLDASLTYSLALSPSGDRLFAPRHALGAMGREAWFGAATVDVLLTESEEPLSPLHHGNLPILRSELADQVRTPDTLANLPATPLTPFTQPRATLYREKTDTLLVIGEGDDRLVELDARALDPTLSVLRAVELENKRDAYLGVATECGAPTGLALSRDEDTAWVWCRSTYSIAHVDLGQPGRHPAPDEGPTKVMNVAPDPGGEELTIGRRLFYDATDDLVSGGLACAGCHPEGRDDGYVWHEAEFDTESGLHTNFVGVAENIPDLADKHGVPRRTPMLAGRVRPDGPYGWRAESPTLTKRIEAGMGLHRWGGLPDHEPQNLLARAGHLATFLRKGLVVPARRDRDLSDLEKRGQAIFTSAKAQCSNCHRPERDFSDGESYPLKPLPTPVGFDPDPPNTEYKTPSLLFVGGRPPYLHDGRFDSLKQLLLENGNRMGDTRHLDDEELDALVAYLETL